MGQMLLTGAGGGASGPTTLILDQFTDTNGTALTSHTIAPTNTPATSWGLVGTINIQSNEANVAAVGADSYGLARCNAGISDAIITANLKTNDAGAAGAISIVLRYTDTNNMFIVGLYNGLFVLYEIAAGSYTLRASTAFAFSTGVFYTVRGTVNGTSISGTVDGGNEITYSSAINQTKTEFGIYGSGTLGKRFDNFTVTTL